MKNKALILLCCLILVICGVRIFMDNSCDINFIPFFLKQRCQQTQDAGSRTLAEDQLQNATDNVEDDLMLIEVFNKDPHTSLAQKEEMAQALVQDLEDLELQECDRSGDSGDCKKKIKLKRKSKKGSVQSGGRVQQLLTPAQARQAIEAITTEIVDVHNTKSLDEHFAEMIRLSTCLDPKVKADVAARKAVEYVKNNKYLITKDLSTWEKVSKGPFVYAAYCGLPKSKEFVELYERDAELFRKILASKDVIKS